MKLWRKTLLTTILATCMLCGGSRGAEPTTSNDALLTEVQQAGFRFFYDFGDPHTGLAHEYSNHRPEVCATGATGMGLFNLIVGSDRGFAPRDQVAARVQLMLHFLSEKADRFHGVFPHWMDIETGKVIPFNPGDDGADLVETAYLAQGLLAVREYFTGTDAVETDIRQLANQLFRDIQWDWHVKEDGDRASLLWHWSPTVGFKKNMGIRGFNECQIAYLLALGSPTHPVPVKCYWTGWQDENYGKDRDLLGIHVGLGRGLQMPMFFTHYSYLGFDPHAISYHGATYFEHFKNLCKVQVAYAKTQEEKYKGYDTLWGLTACDGPDGYRAYVPGKDDGTLAPTAAISSMPYDPQDSLACLTNLNEHYRDRLWGPYGFKDSFNLSRDWVAKNYLGIDVGPIAPMIENYRTGLCWKTFMKAPEINVALKRLHDSQPADQ